MPMLPERLRWNTGVYCWRNLKTGKVYVGSAAKSFDSRKKTHRNFLRAGNHWNIYFQRSWNKWGEANFRFVVLERCRPEKCLEREQFWIDHYRAAEQGYNLSPTAGSPLGIKRSAETKQKISAAKRGVPNPKNRRKLSPEHRAKCRLGRLGKPAPNRGKPSSEEAKAKLRAAWQRRKEKFGPSGVPNPEEVTAKKLATRTRNGPQCRGEDHWSHGKTVRRRANGTYLPKDL